MSFGSFLNDLALTINPASPRGQYAQQQQNLADLSKTLGGIDPQLMQTNPQAAQQQLLSELSKNPLGAELAVKLSLGQLDPQNQLAQAKVSILKGMIPNNATGGSQDPLSQAPIPQPQGTAAPASAPVPQTSPSMQPGSAPNAAAPDPNMLKQYQNAAILKDITGMDLTPGLNYQAEIAKENRTQANEKPTQDQSNAASFAERMVNAEKNIQSITSKGFDPANIEDKAKNAIPLIGNALVSPEFQQVAQAQRDWVTAKLRKESGAAIGKDEMAKDIQTYFPQVGDSPEVIAQKEANRAVVTKGMIDAANKFYKAPVSDPKQNSGIVNLKTLSTEDLKALRAKLAGGQ